MYEGQPASRAIQFASNPVMTYVSGRIIQTSKNILPPLALSAGLCVVVFLLSTTAFRVELVSSGYPYRTHAPSSGPPQGETSRDAESDGGGERAGEHGQEADSCTA